MRILGSRLKKIRKKFTSRHRHRIKGLSAITGLNFTRGRKVVWIRSQFRRWMEMVSVLEWDLMIWQLFRAKITTPAKLRKARKKTRGFREQWIRLPKVFKVPIDRFIPRMQDRLVEAIKTHLTTLANSTEDRIQNRHKIKEITYNHSSMVIGSLGCTRKCRVNRCLADNFKGKWAHKSSLKALIRSEIDSRRKDRRRISSKLLLKYWRSQTRPVTRTLRSRVIRCPRLTLWLAAKTRVKGRLIRKKGRRSTRGSRSRREILEHPAHLICSTKAMSAKIKRQLNRPCSSMRRTIRICDFLAQKPRLSREGRPWCAQTRTTTHKFLFKTRFPAEYLTQSKRRRATSQLNLTL